MHTLHFRELFLVCALVVASACGEDKGGETEASTTATTSGTGTATATSTSGDATMTDGTGSIMPDESTTSPNPTSTTNGPTTDPTTDPTTGPTTMSTDSTEDPTGDGGGQYCQESCQSDSDCTAMGMDIGFSCVDNRCQGSAGGCTDDDACRTTFSGWVMTCASQADCPGQACIDIGGGEGRCATIPSDFLMCETILQKEMVMPAIEGDMDMVVCANNEYVCHDKVCINPCEDDLSCTMHSGHPKCNVDTGDCECTSDADCMNAGIMVFARCHNGVCGCGSDADCAGPNSDVCTKDGYCGCSSTAVCTTKGFDGTMPVCEGI